MSGLLALFLVGAAPALAHAEETKPAETKPAEAPSDAPAVVSGEAPAKQAWCASELTTLSNGVCYFAPEAPARKEGEPAARRTLVIFLHGLTEEGHGWEHTMQKGMMLYATKHRFSLLVPRGRNGVGPDRKESVIAWPLGTDVREKYEAAVLDEWAAARKEVEAQEGAAFDEVFVMGFSNGAYFTTSLALRQRLNVDGFAAFAGGSNSGLAPIKSAPKGAKPLFVGVASKDGTTRDKATELVKALKKAKWPHKSESRKVGHVVGDAHIDAAIAYLRAQKDGKADTEAAAPEETAMPPETKPTDDADTAKSAKSTKPTKSANKKPAKTKSKRARSTKKKK